MQTNMLKKVAKSSLISLKNARNNTINKNTLFTPLIKSFSNTSNETPDRIKNWENILSQNNDATEISKNTEEFYDSWSKEYDECVKHWGYNIDEISVNLFKKYCNLNEKLNILDFGCGSGLVGNELKRHNDIQYVLYTIIHIFIHVITKRVSY